MRILVVEGVKKIASVICRGLEEAQYEVHKAADGEEGLKLALEKSFELIVLDWKLPKKDGLSVLKDLRRKENMTPILMLTTKRSVDYVLERLEPGSNDYLTKPFAFVELLTRVKMLLNRSEMDKGAEIRFADLRLDPVTHRVWRKYKEIDLTANEYGLLKIFMCNPNKVMTRSTIEEYVTFSTFTNGIGAYVNYLRKKIDSEAGKKLIHTVRGVGYVLKEE